MSESKSFLGEPNPIFADKELLRVSHLPEGDRIIGQDDELQSLAKAIKDAQRGGIQTTSCFMKKLGPARAFLS